MQIAMRLRFFFFVRSMRVLGSAGVGKIQCKLNNELFLKIPSFRIRVINHATIAFCLAGFTSTKVENDVLHDIQF